MNYYERHIGDYLKDTSHLSLLEHGIYGRLLDVYYTREGAIPDAQAARLIGARSKDERAALTAVLSEFFVLSDGHWHQGRCDAEIEAYKGKQAEKGDTKEAAKERQRRARERRAQLFEALRSHGITMSFKATTADLEAELSRVTSHAMSRNVTRDESQGVTRDDTATQTPDTSHQSPDPNTHTESSPPPMARAPSLAGQVCMAMKAAGISDINPGHLDLLKLIEAGATLDEFIGAASEARAKSKGFAYAIGTVKRRREEAAAAKPLHHGAMPQRQPTQSELNALTAGYMTGAVPLPNEPHPWQTQASNPETIDVQSRILPA